MYCIIKGHDFEHELQTIGQIFYKNQGFCRVDSIPADGVCLLSCFDDGSLTSGLYIDGSEVSLNASKLDPDILQSRDKLCFAVKSQMFKLISEFTSKNTPWGSLTGIRPTKIMHSLLNEGLEEASAVKFIQEKYSVSAEKARLLAEVVDVQQGLLKSRNINDVSIYISIPFCPTRCHYCSFAAHPMDKYSKHTDSYVDALINELSGTKKLIEGMNVRTIYIGGGTPTALTVSQLERLLCNVEDTFCLDNIQEYSVEAGRPDTITEENLKLLKKYGVLRISINPQTLKSETLAQIGREHTPQQFFNAYNIAREAGFDFINVDLIAGLPGESVSDFDNTLEKICLLSPENLTVHTLAIKRASKFKEDMVDKGATFESSGVGNMLSLAYEYAKNFDMKPYYLYRQKNMVDLFENVGYAKKGRECIYNIHIMEETETIIAFGAGAVTKYVYPMENRIERIANVKDVLEYIKRNIID